MVTFSQFINFYIQNWYLIKPILQMFGWAFLIAYIFKARFYILESIKSIFRDMYRLKKIVIVGKDGVLRSYSVNFKEDYFMQDEKKMYVLSSKSFYYDQFGEKVYFYNAEGTEPITFKEWKKNIYVDVNTLEPLLDKNGKFVTKLNFLQAASNKYVKTANTEARKIESYVKQGLLDESIGVMVKYPSAIGDEIAGTDPVLTADIINRHLEIESIGFLKKYWKIIVMCAILALLLILAGLYMNYMANSKIDALKFQFDNLATNITINMKPVGGMVT